MTKDKKLAYGAAISASVLMGSMGVFVCNVAADATCIAFARLSLGFVFLAIFMGVTGKPGAARIPISPYLMASGLSIGLCVWSYIQAIEHTSLATAVFLLYLGPPLAMGLAHGLLGEHLTLRSIALLDVAFLGCLLVLQFDFSFSRADALGYRYGLLSAAAYALMIVMNRKLPVTILPLGRSFHQLLVAALVLLPFLDWQDIVVPSRDLPWLMAVGFFQGFICLTLMIFAMRHLTAHEYGILSYLEPVTASLIGVAIYAEPMTPLQVLGGSLIVLGGIGQVFGRQADGSPDDG